MGQTDGVSMPATDLYGAVRPDTIRDRFVREYGEATVTRAEIQVCLDLFMLMGVVKPSEFVDVLERKLKRVDLERQIEAGLKGGL